MNQPDDNSQVNAQFDAMMGVDPHPYGQQPAPQTAGSKKTGLNTRGKAVLGSAGVLLAVGGFFVYQDNEADIAAQNAKQAEIALQQKRLDIERIKVTNQVDQQHAKEQKAAEKGLQAKVDACVDANRDKSAYLQGTIDACRDQYASSSGDSPGMEEASSSTGLDTDGSISPVWLVGAAVTGVGVVVFARRGRRDDTDTSPNGYVVVPAPHRP